MFFFHFFSLTLSLLLSSLFLSLSLFSSLTLSLLLSSLCLSLTLSLLLSSLFLSHNLSLFLSVTLTLPYCFFLSIFHSCSLHIFSFSLILSFCSLSLSHSLLFSLSLSVALSFTHCCSHFLSLSLSLTQCAPFPLPLVASFLPKRLRWFSVLLSYPRNLYFYRLTRFYKILMEPSKRTKEPQTNSSFANGVAQDTLELLSAHTACTVRRVGKDPPREWSKL